MDTYTIKKAYPWADTNEITIEGEGLRYSELGETHSGCQCIRPKNRAKIHKKCIKIPKLIKEIEELNKID